MIEYDFDDFSANDIDSPLVYVQASADKTSATVAVKNVSPKNYTEPSTHPKTWLNLHGSAREIQDYLRTPVQIARIQRIIAGGYIGTTRGYRSASMQEHQYIILVMDAQHAVREIEEDWYAT